MPARTSRSNGSSAVSCEYTVTTFSSRVARRSTGRRAVGAHEFIIPFFSNPSRRPTTVYELTASQTLHHRPHPHTYATPRHTRKQPFKLLHLSSSFFPNPKVRNCLRVRIGRGRPQPLPKQLCRNHTHLISCKLPRQQHHSYQYRSRPSN